MIIRLPMAFAAGLALLAFVELLIPAGNGPESAGLPRVTHFEPSLGQATVFSTEWSAIMLARPLFRADRRPIAVAAVTVDDTLPRLSAIVVTAAGRMAAFDGGSPPVVSVGNQLGAYQVRKITPDSVLLRGPNGDVTVHPEFASDGAATGGGATAANPLAAPNPAAPGGISLPVPDDGQPPAAPTTQSPNVTQ